MRGRAAAQEGPALIAKTPIPLKNVEGRIDHFSVDVKGQRLLASANGNHSLEVIDLKAGRQVHTIPDLDEPQGAYYDAATNRAALVHGEIVPALRAGEVNRFQDVFCQEYR
jgi:hypothetical protein